MPRCRAVKRPYSASEEGRSRKRLKPVETEVERRARVKAELLKPVKQKPNRRSSASPKRTRERTARRRSASPAYDTTPYSLSVKYKDAKTGKTEEHFVHELSSFTKQNKAFRTRRLAKNCIENSEK